MTTSLSLASPTTTSESTPEVVVRLAGHGGFRHATELTASLLPLCALRPVLVILDLSELEFISSLMIGVLSDFHRGIIRTGGRVHLTAVKEPVREALQRSGLLSPPGVPEAA